MRVADLPRCSEGGRSRNRQFYAKVREVKAETLAAAAEPPDLLTAECRHHWDFLLAEGAAWEQMEAELAKLRNLNLDRPTIIKIHRVVYLAAGMTRQAARSGRVFDRARPWMRKRDRCLKKLRTLEQELGSIYDGLDRMFLATMRYFAEHHGWRVPEEDAEASARRVEEAFAALLHAIEEDPVLTLKIQRGRGNQPEAYKQEALRMLMDLRVPRETSTALLRLVGVKPLDT